MKMLGSNAEVRVNKRIFLLNGYGTIVTLAICEDYDARIIIGSEEAYYSDQNQHPMNYYIDGELAVGRIELCGSGRWSPICQDNWNEKDASVACFQLGFSRAGYLYHTSQC